MSHGFKASYRPYMQEYRHYLVEDLMNRNSLSPITGCQDALVCLVSNPASSLEWDLPLSRSLIKNY